MYKVWKIYRDKAKRLTRPTIVSIVEAITIPTTTIQQAIATTTIRPIPTTISGRVSHSNTISDYVFYGIHAVKY